MSSIHIHDIEVDGPTLTVGVSASPSLRRFFTGEPFRVDYDHPVDDVPEAILTIPVLSQVCPVAWTQGADVFVPAVDATFDRALEDVKAALLSMYDFMDGGRLVADRRVDVAADESVTEANRGSTTSAGLLFTGGVDSTCSYVRHRDETPVLFSIRGWTITPDPADDSKWEAVTSRVADFADARGLGTEFVEANMLDALDHPMLLAHFKRRVDGAWYSSVGHGLGLLGLCAPAVHARGIEDLYVAATHWEGVDLEWGSRPDVDDHVRWADTRCRHDGYELTRQERIDRIAEHVRTDAPDLKLQTCNDRFDGNCGACEKCYRTALGLRLSGLDPNDHGYAFEPADYREIRRAFEAGTWTLGQDEKYMWADIRDRARETEPDSSTERAFFAWFDDANLDDLVDGSGPPVAHRLLRAGARNAPNPVYNTLYPAWSAAKRGFR